MGYTVDPLDLTPMAGALGVEVANVDLAHGVDDLTIAHIRQQLLKHRVVVFRGQTLDPKTLREFAARFGDLNVHPYVDPLSGHPEVFAIIKEADDVHHFGNGWHTDLSYAEKPAMATMLYGVEIPPRGGDTLFSNLQLAYEQLSEGMKRALGPLHIVTSNAMTYGPDAERFAAGTKSMAVAQQTEISQVSHPLVRTHPETSKKSLYLSPLHTLHLDGMTVEESKPIIDFLATWCTRPEFTVRVPWQRGTLVVWDNHCTMHYAVDDFMGYRRVMHRVTIDGDKPV